MKTNKQKIESGINTLDNVDTFAFLFQLIGAIVSVVSVFFFIWSENSFACKILLTGIVTLIISTLFRAFLGGLLKELREKLKHSN